MAFRADTVFENSVFPQKDAQPQDCAERGFGGNATNKQMHKRVPVCPACRFAENRIYYSFTQLNGSCG